ncbi:MAG: nucleotidyltransferase [Chromatiaceae bacterium]|nr:nucleotidyltransferase [Chromatiaceae bacterium]
MISSEQKQLLLERMVELLELPESAYQKAKDRYEDIGVYLSRETSACHDNDPHIFPQGSFRLGTAIRPLDEREEYDLDLACNLTQGISHRTHTQTDLKHLIGGEINSYREARNIKVPVEEKHRCWRLEYADQLSFHIDIVPCIPGDMSRQRLLSESMVAAGENRALSESVTHQAVSITDDRHPHYKQLSDDWNISNPEGYAQWFESKILPKSPIFMEKAQIDDLPLYKRKSPLQRSIQLLKRHRDQMFKEDPDVKPISVIITTIAAKAYSGQSAHDVTLQVIIDELKRFSDSGSTVVPNPVNPEENFSDRWTMPQYKHLRLRENFSSWVTQVHIDFSTLVSLADPRLIAEHARQKFSIRPTAGDLGALLGLSVAPAIHTGKTHEIPDNPAKPWRLG